MSRGPQFAPPALASGAKRIPWRWLVPAATAALVWLLPHGRFEPRDWGLLCVFAATVAGMVAQPLPAAAVVLLGLTAANLPGILSLPETLAGFANATVWLIVAAFVFARGFLATGLGERIAYGLIAAFGGTSLRLGYALVLADLAMAPVTPSNTARAGGVIFPVALSVAHAFDSRPGPTADRLGAFLLKATYQADLVVSAMFLTSMAANPLVAEMAQQASNTTITWGQWLLASALPGLVGLAVVPFAVYRLCPAQLQATGEARELARARLRQMGPMGRGQKVMLAAFVLVLALWVSASWHGLSSTTVAYVGIAVLLVSRTLRWQDVLEEKGAWDALVWFGGLVALAGELNDRGLTRAFAEAASSWVVGWPWPAALAGLLLVYLYAHYGFASLTAHVTALFPAFFAVACAQGAPPLLAALALGFFSNINAAMTHYGTGPAPIFFGAGYLSQGRWWRIGFALSLVHAAIWLLVGFAWWRLIGLW